MTHAVLGAIIPKIRGDMLAGQRLQRRRCDETARRFGHHDAHGEACIASPANEFKAFIGGKYAPYYEQDTLTSRAHLTRFVAPEVPEFST
jgi:hypothetical protein